MHPIYRDPSNDYAGSLTQQASAGMSGGPGGGDTPPNGDTPPQGGTPPAQG